MSRNSGSSQLAKLQSTFSIAASQRRFLHLGTNLILPGRGVLSASATPSSWMGVFREKQFLSHPRVRGKAAIFLLRKPNTRLRRPAAWCPGPCRSGFILMKLDCGRAALSVSKSGNPVEACPYCAVGTDDRMWAEVGGRATEWRTKAAATERNPRISYEGRRACQ